MPSDLDLPSHGAGDAVGHPASTDEDDTEAVPPSTTGPFVHHLDDPQATVVERTGAKAAALAKAAVAGLPTLPGFVLTTSATAAVDRSGGNLSVVEPDARAAWEDLSDHGRRTLVVRSSSTTEDLADSSMAGRYESVVGVAGWEAFLEAIEVVLRSRTAAAEGQPDLDPDHPIAVLVQPLLDAAVGGVLFGVDPVTGRSDRIVVAAVEGGPDALVSGAVDGARYEIDDEGKVCSHTPGEGGADLDADLRHDLLTLAERAATTFGGPQDVEWAVDRHGGLWLLQSRPVTTEVAGVPSGPVLGPGPVAETYPEPLTRLEVGMWIPPLRRALRTVFELAGTATPDELDASPLVTTVDGRVAVDLELFGEVPRPRGRWSAIDPRPRIRHLRAAWRVGRLRSALPDLAADLLARTDAELAGMPPVEDLTDRQLLALIDRAGDALVAVHGHEILMGLLLAEATPRYTGASVALRVLAHARADGLDDDAIAARHPVVLALSPPHVAPVPALPPTDDAPAWAPPPEGDRAALLREALRLRARWLQELSGRAAWMLGERLVGRGVLDDAGDVRRLPLTTLRALVCGRAVLWQVGPPPDPDLPALPAQFQLTGNGRPVAVRNGDERGDGSGAGGGSGRGPVTTDHTAPPPGSVLVVRNLDPSLATVLSGLAGVVAETGSVLSHVAILAREAGIPTVVGLPGAFDRFEEGTIVDVDGTTGEVEEVEGR